MIHLFGSMVKFGKMLQAKAFENKRIQFYLIIFDI